MLIKITEEELATRGFTLTDREEWFIAAHPEWKGKTKELLGIYLTCQSDPSSNSRVVFEQALLHVQNCTWCRNRLKVRTASLADSAVMPS